MRCLGSLAAKLSLSLSDSDWLCSALSWQRWKQPRPGVTGVTRRVTESRCSVSGDQWRVTSGAQGIVTTVTIQPGNIPVQANSVRCRYFWFSQKHHLVIKIISVKYQIVWLDEHKKAIYINRLYYLNIKIHFLWIFTLAWKTWKTTLFLSFSIIFVAFYSSDFGYNAVPCDPRAVPWFVNLFLCFCS